MDPINQLFMLCGFLFIISVVEVYFILAMHTDLDSRLQVLENSSKHDEES